MANRNRRFALAAIWLTFMFVAMPGSASAATPTATPTATATPPIATPTPTGGGTATPTPTATAGVIVVNSLSDDATAGDGMCSLRKAINNSNASGDTTGGDCAPGTGVDTIEIGVTGTITLKSTLPPITSTSLRIEGGVPPTIDGGGSNQILVVDNSAVVLYNLILQNGSASNGGAVSVMGSLQVIYCTFQSNTASGHGGAIFGASNTAQIEADNSTFTSNTAGMGGGAIYNPGGLIVGSGTFSSNSGGNNGSGGAIDNVEPGGTAINNSYFFSNTAGQGGGAINNSSVTNTVQISTSTFNANTTTSDGGAVANTGNEVDIVNSTFASNSAFAGGGTSNTVGIVGIHDCTFSGNSASASDGAAIFDTAMAPNGTTVAASILAASTSGGNCDGVAGTIVDGGFNISDDTTCGFKGTGAQGQTLGDGVSPKLDPAGLQNNGGFTLTIAEEPGSPSIDAVTSMECSMIANGDQRLRPRPDPEDSSNGPCDIGAYELQDAPGPTPSPTSGPSPTATPTRTPTPTQAATPTPTPTCGQVSVSPTSLSFEAGQTGKQTVKVTNTGSLSVNVISAKITNTIRKDFKVSEDKCAGTTLASGGSCNVSVSFDGTIHQAAGTLTITDTACNSPQAIGLQDVKFK